jgi:hypothetical protein
LSLLTLNVSRSTSPGPLLIAVAQPLTVTAAASSSGVWSAPLVNDGGSLTAVTLMTKVCVGD